MLKILAYKEDHSNIQKWIIEFVTFGYHNALSCLFPAYIFFILWASHFIHIPGLYRYDLLLILCVAMQALMYFTKLETWDEVKVICLFHLFGLTMEIFKVNHGCWSYPEHALTKVAGVPLYSGFMYASVASYICQAWRRFDLEMINWPSKWLTIPVGAAIYLNFFTNNYFYDLRWLIVLALIIIFFKTKVNFTNNGPRRQMPQLLAFGLIGLFIWFAENIATFLGAWQYTYQHNGWQVVHFQKLSSWGLLVIVSIIIVAELKFAKKSTVNSPQTTF